MLPSIELRIDNLLKSLQQVVIPAIPRNERLARDQAMLVVGHLQMIAVQWKSALRFESQSLDELLGLAGRLRDAKGVDLTREVRDRLEGAIAAAGSVDRTDASGIEAGQLRLGGVIDEIIRADDVQDPIAPELMTLVLDYGKRQSWRERCWFQDSKLDPGRADLPSIDGMLSQAPALE
jgi:hypothetical protein